MDEIDTPMIINTIQKVIFEALNFRGLLKLQHFADFSRIEVHLTTTLQ